MSDAQRISDPQSENVAELEVKTTTCYMCACRCGIRVYLRNGEVRFIDGNPAHPLNKGVICAVPAEQITPYKENKREGCS